MKGKFFLDTNVFIYSFSSDPKSQIAKEWIKQALAEQQGVISYQVIQEFLNVALKKFEKPLELHDCQLYLNKVLSPLCQIYPNVDLYEKALFISGRYRYGFYDSLIIASALNAQCKTLISEDLAHQQVIDGLTILNPFMPSSTKFVFAH